MNIKTELPEEQKAILIEALHTLEVAMIGMNTEQKQSKIFDILTLHSLLKERVYVEVDKETYERFAHKHGVDFPNYN